MADLLHRSRELGPAIRAGEQAPTLTCSILPPTPTQRPTRVAPLPALRKECGVAQVSPRAAAPKGRRPGPRPVEQWRLRHAAPASRARTGGLTGKAQRLATQHRVCFAAAHAEESCLSLPTPSRHSTQAQPSSSQPLHPARQGDSRGAR